ncbi:phytoene/squalene synthase family protein [Benzoatithermus flavus]|uniref:Squalene/phytoene synthase family protein n=1 Tax=Benzoatithermus flavus TaxID=3108223 RepID=A0ABU8XWX8_9PROT
MQPHERSFYLAAEARRHDPDRYLCALFAPAERRDAVLALVLLHHELARVPDVVSQPMAGYIRYQWWRDALAEIDQGEGPRRHPVVLALAQAFREGWVAGPALQALIDARERELDEVVAEDLPALERYVAATSGALQAIIYRALGGNAPAEAEAATAIGTAFGLVGIARAVAHGMRHRRQSLPAGLLRPAAAVDEASTAQPLAGAIGAVLERVEALLTAGRARAGRPTRAVMAAFLPATLAAGYAVRIRRLDCDPIRAAGLTRPATAPLQLLAHVLLRRP